MATKTSMKYDPTTKKWVKVSVSTTSSTSKPSTKKPSESTGNDVSSLKTTSSSKKKTAKAKTTKKVNRKTLYSLQGSLNILPTEKTIHLKAGDTIKLGNLGKYLSGKYYVKSVTREFSTSGYSQSAEVLKTNFRKTIKIKSKTKK